ncbi:MULTISPECIES: oligosaccharide flippase family protein [unclassified Vibrio]|uniref:oligosaccharide flippase family protein n=1 Tax=unclassified Vibrio TaxID=2614977 RepID=UPI000CC0F0FD|nr:MULTISPECIES: oligosaccharide flippase family protein [unclassified Vibrio]PMK18706.1 hypothetical protein BCU05_17345 [Vibrio sp. 10N.261.54.C3]
MRIDIFAKFFSTGSIVASSKLLGILFGVICARLLSPEEYGTYTYLISVTTILMTLTMAGVPHVLIRNIAEYRIKGKDYSTYIRWSYFHIITLSLALIIIVWLTTEVFGLLEWDRFALITACLVIPLRALNAQQSACLNGKGMPALAQLPFSLLVPLISLVIVAFLYLIGVSFRLDGFYLIYVSALLFSFVLSQVIISTDNKKYTFICAKENFDMFFLKKTYSDLIPYSITVITLTINAELAVIYLANSSDKEAVALYRVAIQLISVVSMLYFVVNTVLQPRVSSLYSQRDFSALQIILKLSSRFVCLLSIPLLFSLYYWGEGLVIFIFGNEYSEAKFILSIMCAAQLIISMFSSSPVVLNMTGNQRISMKCSYLSLSSNVVCLTVLTPFFQEVGVAYAYLISNSILYITMSYFSFKKLNLKTWVH